MPFEIARNDITNMRVDAIAVGSAPAAPCPPTGNKRWTQTTRKEEKHPLINCLPNPHTPYKNRARWYPQQA